MSNVSINTMIIVILIQTDPNKIIHPACVYKLKILHTYISSSQIKNLNRKWQCKSMFAFSIAGIVHVQDVSKSSHCVCLSPRTRRSKRQRASFECCSVLDHKASFCPRWSHLLEDCWYQVQAYLLDWYRVASMGLLPLLFGTNGYSLRSSYQSLCRADTQFCPLP